MVKNHTLLIEQLKPFFNNSLTLCIILISITIITQIPFFFHAEYFFNADEAFNAIISQRIVHGTFFSLALPGADSYQGITEILFSIPLQWVFGPSALSYKLGIFILYLVLVICTFSLLRLLGATKGWAFLCTLPLAYNTWQLRYFSFFATGGHTTITVMGTVALYCFFKSRYQTRHRPFWIFSATFLVGLAYYTYALAVCYILLLSVVTVIENGFVGTVKKAVFEKSGRFAVLGLSIGLLPLVLKKIWQPLSDTGSVMQFFSASQITDNISLLFQQILPCLIGFNYSRHPWVDATLNIQPSLLFSIIGYIYSIVVLGFVVFFCWYSFIHVKTVPGFQRRSLDASAIMSFGVIVMLLLLLFTPALINIHTRRYLLPLLSFLPFCLFKYFKAVFHRLGRSVFIIVFGVFIIFTTLQQHLFLSQNQLYSRKPITAEKSFQNVIQFLADNQITYSISDYWISHKLTYLANGSHFSLSPYNVQRDPVYRQAHINQMRQSALNQIAYIFYKHSETVKRWQNKFLTTADDYQMFENQDYKIYWNVKSGESGVALRTTNGYYLSALNGGGGQVVAHGKNIGPWETFEVVYLKNNKIALKTHTGHYVTALSGGGGDVGAYWDGIGAWETFEKVNLKNNQIVLKTHNGNSVCALKGGWNNVVAHPCGEGAWNTLTIVYLNRYLLDEAHPWRYQELEAASR